MQELGWTSAEGNDSRQAGVEESKAKGRVRDAARTKSSGGIGLQTRAAGPPSGRSWTANAGRGESRAGASQKSGWKLASWCPESHKQSTIVCD